ncbi:hypothetical protein ACFE04_001697 [Oxalis oulophora]
MGKHSISALKQRGLFKPSEKSPNSKGCKIECQERLSLWAGVVFLPAQTSELSTMKHLGSGSTSVAKKPPPPPHHRMAKARKVDHARWIATSYRCQRLRQDRELSKVLTSRIGICSVSFIEAILVKQLRLSIERMNVERRR